MALLIQAFLNVFNLEIKASEIFDRALAENKNRSMNCLDLVMSNLSLKPYYADC